MQVLVTTLLLGVCADLESPFGSDPMDLPGLSYVAAAAETTLANVLPPSAATAHAKREITTLDKSTLLQHSELAEALRRGDGGTAEDDPVGVLPHAPAHVRLPAPSVLASLSRAPAVPHAVRQFGQVEPFATRVTAGHGMATSKLRA